MPFDVASWMRALLRSGQEEVVADDLLTASGLIDSDYLEEDIEFLMRDIEADLDDPERQPERKK